MGNWQQLDGAEVLRHLETDSTSGLSQEEVDRRLLQYGTNELAEHPPKSLWLMAWEQLIATPVLVLIAAAGIAASLGDYKDTAVILAIVIFNAILGVTQEYRAGKAFAALEKLTVPHVKVCRDSRWQEISASQLVPGDIVMLEVGELIPADCRLLNSHNLQVREVTFTGELDPVNKQIDAVKGEDLSLADHHSMVYMGTIITYGRGQAVVTETGMNTQLGKVTHAIQTAEVELTPLQNRLEILGRKLAIATLALVLLIFLLGILQGEPLHLMILTAISMAVAVIPEGLPAVVTIALAIGSQRMLKHRALIRRLPAVETLGSVTVICSDKTGTLTESRMAVSLLEVANQRFELKTLTPTGHLVTQTSSSDDFLDQNGAPATLLLAAAALCNDALIVAAHESNPSALGDPTEIALLQAAASQGIHKSALEKNFPRVAEVPFDSDRKRMTTIHQAISSPYIALTKGAVGNLLEVSTQVWTPAGIKPLDRNSLDKLKAANDQLAQAGMRVLGIAFCLLDELPEQISAATIERDLVFIGMLGMQDPVRAEAKSAVTICQKAGIRPVMITGDHPLLAKHVAKDLGIETNGHLLTGKDLNQLSLEELAEKVETVSVYARVSPQQKLKIVQALQHRGQIVAMTGDGVNDAAALKKANIGVAMGITGTDVAKEAADMVLLDDNFATIVAAVEEGRVIYDNIRKFIKYSMTGNASGIWIMLLAPMLAMPLPLLPLQILWVNLLADGLLAIALSVEPAEQETMNRPPYHPNENVFSRGAGRDIIWLGLLVGIALVMLGYGLWTSANPDWQTGLFVGLAFSRMSLALAMRSERDSLFSIGLTSNIPMLVAVVLTFCLQIAVIYIPWLQDIFKTQALSLSELFLCLAVSTIGFWAIELEKWTIRYSSRFKRE